VLRVPTATWIKEHLTPAHGETASIHTAYGTYLMWCVDQRIEPLTVRGFGKHVPAMREKRNGKVWYLDTDLA
jgi:hypothetical protein